MKCLNCGAELLDTDRFCNKCGHKIVSQPKCPDCGTLLREGTRFCHKCGRLVGEDEEIPVSRETLDIPIEQIEQNILFETESEMKSAREKMRDDAGKDIKTDTGKHPEGSREKTEETIEKKVKKKNVSQKAAQKPVRTKKVVYEEEYEDEEYEDEEYEEYEDEEYDEYDEEGGLDPMTIATVAVGCVILILVIVLGFHFYRQYMPKDYGDTAQETEEEQDSETQGSEGAETAGMYRLTVVSNVNVRDNPDTQGTNVLKVAKAGEVYDCIGEAGDGNWYEIVLEDGTHGYVYTDYVNVE